MITLNHVLSNALYFGGERLLILLCRIDDVLLMPVN